MQPIGKDDLKTVSEPGDSAEILHYATGECALGQVLISRSAKGVCAILLGGNDAELQADLLARFPKSMHVVEPSAVREDLTKVIRFVEKPTEELHLTLDVRGTPFQRRVWEKLRAVSLGREVTDLELARWISSVASPRAVAAACAANPIALAIPCHRLVQADGELASYRRGVERKHELLARERRPQV